MTTSLFFALPGNEELTRALARETQGEVGRVQLRRFPDGESYVRLETPVAGRDVVAVCTLDRPDDKLLPLLFLAATARELGARTVGLVAPYLAYMRQDRRFHDGEGITSTYFAELVSRGVTRLVTVDPHLHRRRALAEIYSIPTCVLHAAPQISAWIGATVAQPLLIGPDEESAQWVEEVARGANAPSIVLRKLRRGDTDVEVSVPDIERWRDHTPVLVDDIISTGRTMIETIRHLRAGGHRAPVCVGVHAVFAEGAYEALMESGAGRVVTCNTVPHSSNAIELTALLADALRTAQAGERGCRPVVPTRDVPLTNPDREQRATTGGH